MMNIRFKYKVALSSIVIMMVFVTLTGFSYAYFTSQIVGEGNPIDLTTAKVEMTFGEGETDNINLLNAYPISDTQGLEGTPHTFNLTNPNTFDVTVYIFLSVLDDSDQELLSHIKVAYNNPKTEASANQGYNIKFLDVAGSESTSLVDSTMWPKVTDNVLDGATSYLLDTVELGASSTATNSIEGLKLLLWIDEQTGGIVECNTDATGNTTCTLPNDESNQDENCTTTVDPAGKKTTICVPETSTMGKSFKARLSIRAVPKRAPNSVQSGEPIELGE